MFTDRQETLYLQVGQFFSFKKNPNLEIYAYFFRNLILGEHHDLKNRYMLIGYADELLAPSSNPSSNDDDPSSNPSSSGSSMIGTDNEFILR